MILGRGEETKFLNACELVGGSQLRCLKVSEKGRRRRKVCGIPVVTVAWTWRGWRWPGDSAESWVSLGVFWVPVNGSTLLTVRPLCHVGGVNRFDIGGFFISFTFVYWVRTFKRAYDHNFQVISDLWWLIWGQSTMEALEENLSIATIRGDLVITTCAENMHIKLTI